MITDQDLTGAAAPAPGLLPQALAPSCPGHCDQCTRWVKGPCPLSDCRLCWPTPVSLGFGLQQRRERGRSQGHGAPSQPAIKVMSLHSQNRMVIFMLEYTLPRKIPCCSEITLGAFLQGNVTRDFPPSRLLSEERTDLHHWLRDHEP